MSRERAAAAPAVLPEAQTGANGETIRGKASIHSQLEDIPGIGPKRRKALLTKLGSMKAIREATEEELLKVPEMNQAAAKAVRKWAEAQEKK